MPRAGSSRTSQPTAGGSSSSTTPSARGNTRRKRKEEQSMMDEYHDMLVDSYQTDPSMFAKDTTAESRPRKRPGASASMRKPAVATTDSTAKTTSTAPTTTAATAAATTPTKPSVTMNTGLKDTLNEAKVEVTTTPSGKSKAIETPSSTNAESSRKRRRMENYNGHTGDEKKVSPKSSKGKGTTGDEEMLDVDAVSEVADDSNVDAAVQDSGSEYDSEEEEDEDDSDVDWENIDLGKPAIMTVPAPIKKQPSNLSVDVTALIAERDKSKRNRRGPGNRRKPPTPMERKIRLEVHKLHVLCMLAHANLRSEYCNDTVAQKRLRKILDKKVISELMDHPTSHEYSARLKTGLSNATFHFRRKFKVILPGLRKPLWRDDEDEDENGNNNGKGRGAEIPAYGDEAISLEEFRAAAMNMEGTRDLGAQLFCAMLRAIGMTVRLVTSLQVLSYTFTKAGRKDTTTERTKGALKPSETMTPSRKMGSGSSSASTFKGEVNPKFGGPGPMVAGEVVPRSKKETTGSPSKVIPKKPVILPKMNHPEFPVYWVEVFDTRAQEWITVDPLVTRTVKKPLQLEPPMSDAHDIEMAYVVAFEAEGQAKDVTRRYVKAYNGRTRLIRVEATKDGDKWWRKALKPFRRGYPLDRDQIEEAALSQRELAEGLPSNIAAFKTHPVFALEELCRRNEVIYPKRQVATMPGGRMKKGGKPIPVYRRSDVKIVKTARQWYMLGRVINVGEQPLKMQIKKPSQQRKNKEGYGSDDNNDGEEDEEVNQGMYAEHQTSLYEPPAVMFGLIPKNNFGNVDVFVPSMVPKGAVHLTRSNKLLSKAAKELDIDYADAIVGFDHKGRTATAIIRGIVVAEENAEKIQEKLAEMEAEIAEEERIKKQIEMLKLWRKFLIGLRIIERLDEYGPVDDDKDGEALSSLDKGKMKAIFSNIEEEVEQGQADEPEEEEAGGFFRGGEGEEEEDKYAGGGGGGFFLPEEGEDDNAANPSPEAGGFLLDGDAGDGDIAMSGSDDEGGGFIPEGEEEGDGGGGGFMPDDEDGAQTPKATVSIDGGNPFMVETDGGGNLSPTYSEKDKAKAKPSASPATAAAEGEGDNDEPLMPEHEDDEEIGEDDFEYDEDDGVDFD